MRKVRPPLWKETSFEIGADYSRQAQIEHRVQMMYFSNPPDAYIPRTDYYPKSWFDQKVSEPFEEELGWDELDSWEDREEEEEEEY